MYQSVLPLSQRSQYNPGENVDFKLSHEGSDLVQGSVKIFGKLKVSVLGARVGAVDIKYDGMAGVSNFINSISTMMNGKILETVQGYSRWIKMRNEATKHQEQLFGQASNSVELCCAQDDQSISVIQGQSATDWSVPFCFRPDVCVNNSVSSLPYKETGDIVLSLRLADVNQALYGVGVDANVSYSLYDLELGYLVAPETSSKPVLHVKQMIQQRITSANQQLSMKVPLPNDRVAMTFLQSDRANTALYNNQDTQMPPGVESVEWSFNDNTSAILANKLETEEEILYNYLNSIGWSGHTSLTQRKLENNKKEFKKKLKEQKNVDKPANMSYNDLKQEAKTKGIKNYWNKKKEQLVEELNSLNKK